MSDLAKKFARRECEIHQKMKHENIIKLYEYRETQDEYQLYMEYANKGEFLAKKILEVFLYILLIIDTETYSY